MSIKNNFPSVGPSLSLNFARSKILDPRITFSRTSVGTYTDGNGLIVTGSADEPRFDHEYENGVVKSLGLLVEEQRTNLVTNNEDLSQWSPNSNPTLNSNDTVSPDGNTTADKVIQTNQVYTGVTTEMSGITTNTVYSCSVFIKPDGDTRTRFGFYDTSNWQGSLDTDWSSGEPSTNGSLGGASDIVYEEYPNGWYRASFKASTQSNAFAGTVSFHCHPDRTGTGKSAWFWGAQLEAGNFETSYIPTSGSTLTRTADNVSMTGTNFSDWYNQEQGTMIWIGNVYSKELSPVQPFRINRTDGGNLRGMAIQFDTRSVNNTVNFMSRTQSSNIPSKVGPTGVIPSDNKIKIAGGYIESVGLSTLRAAFNGLPAASYSGASQTDIVDGAMNELEIMYNRGTSGSNIQFTGVCEQLVYYPKIFTDTQLQNLTK